MVTYAAAVHFFLIPSEFTFRDPSIPWRIIGMLLISTVLIPVTALLFLRKTGMIKTMQIEDQKERNWPLLITALIYFGSFYIIQKSGIPVFIQLFTLGATLGILISLGINLKWKISLHMIGMGGACGGMAVEMLLLQVGDPIILGVLFLLAGLLGTARLYLQAHSPAQIFAGFFTGFAIQFGLMFLMLS